MLPGKAQNLPVVLAAVFDNSGEIALQRDEVPYSAPDPQFLLNLLAGIVIGEHRIQQIPDPAKNASDRQRFQRRLKVGVRPARKQVFIPDCRSELVAGRADEEPSQKIGLAAPDDQTLQFAITRQRKRQNP